MPIWFTVTRVATVLNLALLCALGYVWVRNYRRIRTRFTLGLLVFGAFLLAENGYALYLYLLDPTTSHWFSEIPQRYTVSIMLLTLFQFGALAVLSWITLDSE